MIGEASRGGGRVAKLIPDGLSEDDKYRDPRAAALDTSRAVPRFRCPAAVLAPRPGRRPAHPGLSRPGAAVIAAVHHAEVVAHRVGEPFGTLILALAVTVIEVALIVTLM